MMTNGSFFRFGSVGTVAENFVFVIYFLALAINPFLAFLFDRLIIEWFILPSHALIVESYWD